MRAPRSAAALGLVVAACMAVGGCDGGSDTTPDRSTQPPAPSTPDRSSEQQRSTSTDAQSPGAAARVPGTDQAGAGIVEDGSIDSDALDPASAWTSLLADSGTCPNQREHDAPVRDLERAGSCLVNAARRARGLEPLGRAEPLDASARDKAADLVQCEEFSHTACGRSVVAPFRRAGYVPGCGGWRVGENLGYGEGSGGTPRAIVLGWLRSPTHRRNLLAPDWQVQGMSVVRLAQWRPTFDGEVREARDVLLWVNHFGRRSAC